MFHTLEDILSPLEEKYQADVLVEINNFGTDADHIIATSDNDIVCIDSFRRLKNGCYLNDEILNYICMLENNYDHKCYIRRQRDKLSYTFSSFFMTKLLDENNQYCYANVHKWSNGCHMGDLLGLEYTYFVVNISNCHWTLVVVHIPGKQIRYYNSCGNSGKDYMDAVYRYLDDECQHHHHKCLISDEWQTIDMLNAIPQQGNGESITIKLIICLKYFD